MEIKIEKVKPEEINEVKELLSTTWKATYGQYYPADAIEKITTTWHDPKMLLSQAEDKNIFFAAAKTEDGKIAGIITIKKTDDNTVFMNRLYVSPDFQGKGIGSRLLSAGFDHFPEASKIRVDCEKQNTSGCGFYLKQGFTIIGQEDEIVEGVAMKSVHFEKEIKR